MASEEIERMEKHGSQQLLALVLPFLLPLCAAAEEIVEIKSVALPQAVAIGNASVSAVVVVTRTGLLKLRDVWIVAKINQNDVSRVVGKREVLCGAGELGVIPSIASCSFPVEFRVSNDEPGTPLCAGLAEVSWQVVLAP